VRERVKILEAAGHTPLAYLTAKTHGMEEDAVRLGELLTSANVAIPEIDGMASCT